MSKKTKKGKVKLPKEKEEKIETPETPEIEKTEEEKAKEVETPTGKVKLYDVFDGSGELLNIYESKGVADEFASKVSGRKVVPSPKGRTREDVKAAIGRLKAKRLKELETPGPAV